MSIILLITISLSELSTCSSLDNESFYKMVDNKIEYGDAYVERTAAEIAKEYPGEYSINQVCAIFDALNAGGGWPYKKDVSPDIEKIRYANETLQLGKAINFNGEGDCDDYAILMASLIENLGGTAKVNFVYIPRTKPSDPEIGHAYTEVYLGKKGANTTKLINWLKKEYQIKSKEDRLGINDTFDEVWLNLDWSKWSPGASFHPGGPYFPNWPDIQIGKDHNHNNLDNRTYIRNPANKEIPKIVPVIDYMDSINGWLCKEDTKGSKILSIKPISRKNGTSVEIKYNLTEGGWVKISKNFSPKNLSLSEVAGLKFSYTGSGSLNTIELRLVANKMEFGRQWNGATSTGSWSSHQALYTDFSCISPAEKCESQGELDQAMISEIQFNISNHPHLGDEPGEGLLMIDKIEGVMHIPPGSVWEKVEEDLKSDSARKLAAKSNEARTNPEKFIDSVKFAVESVRTTETLEGNQALRNSLALVPFAAAGMKYDNDPIQACISPDGNYIASTDDDHNLIIWEFSTYNKTAEHNFIDKISDISFSQDGNELAIGGWSGGVSIWVWRTGEIIAFGSHNNTINDIAFSQDDKYLATGSKNGTINVWDVANCTLSNRLNHITPNLTRRWERSNRTWPRNVVNAVAFSEDDRYLATGGEDFTACVWDWMNKTEISRMGHSSEVLSLAFCQNGEFLAMGCNGDASVWDWTGKERVWEIELDGPVDHVALSPDGQILVTGSGRDTVEAWDWAHSKGCAHEDLAAVISLNGNLMSLSFNPEGELIAATQYESRIYELSTVKETIMHNPGAVNSVSFSGDGNVLATGCAGGVRLWNTSTGEMKYSPELYKGANSVAFNPKYETILAIQDMDTVRILNMTNLEEKSNLTYHGEPMSMAFSPEGTHLAIGYRDGTLKNWNWTARKEDFSINTSDSWIWCVAFSPNGKLLATGSIFGIARIWDSTNGKVIKKISTGNQPSTGVAFINDGKLLAIGINDSLQIWNLTKKDPMLFLKLPHDEIVLWVSFNPIRHLLATASHDNVVRVWDLTKKKEIMRVAHDGPVQSVEFSPNGTYLATGSEDGTARLWMVRSEDLACEACCRIKHIIKLESWWDLYCGTCPP